MTQCTWNSIKTGQCVETGLLPQLDKTGKQWACLCPGHALQLDDAVTSGDPRKTLGAWVAAQGGAKAAAGRMRV